MKKRNKKGFTLIELLAVIVILAIIALIATPIVMNLISKARKSAAEDSAYGMVKSAENYYAGTLLETSGNGISSDLEFLCTKDGCKIDEDKELTFNGTKPSSGTITIKPDGKVQIKDLVINNYKCNYKENSTEIECLSSGQAITTTKTTPTTKPKYKVYNDGDPVYYDPSLGKKCNKEDAVSTTGTKSGCMQFYAFNDVGEDSAKLNIILDHNTTPLVAWNSTGSNVEMKEVKEKLEEDTTGWIVAETYDELNERLITADEVAEITGAKETLKWSSSKSYADTPTIETNVSWFYFDGKGTTYSISTGWQKQVAKSQSSSEYAWLFDNTYNCISNGCNISDDNQYEYKTTGSKDNILGYWTSTPMRGRSKIAWYINKDGTLGSTGLSFTSTTGDVYRDNNYGVRPVITVFKSDI